MRVVSFLLGFFAVSHGTDEPDALMLLQTAAKISNQKSTTQNNVQLHQQEQSPTKQAPPGIVGFVRCENDRNFISKCSKIKSVKARTNRHCAQLGYENGGDTVNFHKKNKKCMIVSCGQSDIKEGKKDGNPHRWQIWSKWCPGGIAAVREEERLAEEARKTLAAKEAAAAELEKYKLEYQKRIEEYEKAQKAAEEAEEARRREMEEQYQQQFEDYS